MNDYKATIKEILGTFVYHYGIEANHPAGDLVEPYDEATASLLQLINEARISEATIALDAAQNIDSAIGIGTVIYNRIAELKGEQR